MLDPMKMLLHILLHCMLMNAVPAEGGAPHLLMPSSRMQKSWSACLSIIVSRLRLQSQTPFLIADLHAALGFPQSQLIEVAEQMYAHSQTMGKGTSWSQMLPDAAIRCCRRKYCASSLQDARVAEGSTIDAILRAMSGNTIIEERVQMKVMSQRLIACPRQMPTPLTSAALAASCTRWCSVAQTAPEKDISGHLSCHQRYRRAHPSPWTLGCECGHSGSSSRPLTLF